MTKSEMRKMLIDRLNAEAAYVYEQYEKALIDLKVMARRKNVLITMADNIGIEHDEMNAFYQIIDVDAKAASSDDVMKELAAAATTHVCLVHESIGKYEGRELEATFRQLFEALGPDALATYITEG
jgi:hypothetical protein